MASVHTGDDITTEGEMDKHPCPPGARVLEQGESAHTACRTVTSVVRETQEELWEC